MFFELESSFMTISVLSKPYMTAASIMYHAEEIGTV